MSFSDADEPIGDEPSVIARLESERPVPQPAFRGELGRAITTDSRSLVRPRPEGLWVRVTVLGLAGVALLLLALLVG